MIVEFIGSTGAGKSTLIREIRQELAAEVEVLSSFERIGTPLGIGKISNPSVQNLLQEIIGLPTFLISLPKYQPLISFSLKLLTSQATPALSTINNLRSLIRKISVYESSRRSKNDQVILVDEGTVLLPHNLLVFRAAEHSIEEIESFGKLLPLPDVIIYVRAPMESLVKRAFERSDLRRELAGKDRETVAQFVRRATEIFDALVALPNIAERTFIIENPDSTTQARKAVVQTVTKFILQNVNSYSQTH